MYLRVFFMGLLCFALPAAGPAAEVLIAFDDFSGYSTNLADLDGCDSTTGWSPYADTASIDLNTTSFKEGTGSLQLSYSGSQRSAAYETIPAVDVSSMDKIGFWAYVGDITHSTRFEIRIGQQGNYNEYRSTGEIYRGWNYCEFDLANPYVTVGNPDMTGVTYLWVGYYYASGELPSYWLVDGISAYTAPNFTAGNFYYINDANLYGIASYQNTTGTNELLVNGISRYNSGNHGRALWQAFTLDSFHMAFDFRFNCDDNDVGWMRFLWDFVDGHSYNGVYISRGFSKAGIEQFVNNARTNREIPFTASVGTTYHVDVYVRGNDVEFYVDGNLITSWTVPPSSLAGPYAFESYSGNIDLYQGYTTTIALSNVALFSID